jgi:hypothetical protein
MSTIYPRRISVSCDHKYVTSQITHITIQQQSSETLKNVTFIIQLHVRRPTLYGSKTK